MLNLITVLIDQLAYFAMHWRGKLEFLYLGLDCDVLTERFGFTKQFIWPDEGSI